MTSHSKLRILKYIYTNIYASPKLGLRFLANSVKLKPRQSFLHLLILKTVEAIWVSLHSNVKLKPTNYKEKCCRPTHLLNYFFHSFFFLLMNLLLFSICPLLIVSFYKNTLPPFHSNWLV